MAWLGEVEHKQHATSLLFRLGEREKASCFLGYLRECESDVKYATWLFLSRFIYTSSALGGCMFLSHLDL